MKKLFAFAALFIAYETCFGEPTSPVTCATYDLGSYSIYSSVRFDASRSYDTDGIYGGRAKHWYWDFDYDGSNFTNDADAALLYHTFPREGTYKVAARFYDDDGQAGNIVTMTITIGPLKAYYYLKDHLGSVRMTVDAGGNVAGYDDYDPCGQVLPGRSSNNGLADSKYKFTGKEQDVETSLLYFGARYYDSWRGQWLSVDPLAEKYPGWSPYAYCLGNPIAFLDPNGLWTDPVNKPQYRGFYYKGGGQYKWGPELSRFGENVRGGGSRAHQGVDLKAAAGTQTVAVMTGTIVYAGDTGGDQGTKIVLKFKGSDSKIHYANYWHLSGVKVKKGDLVNEGQIIGETGNTGNAADMKPLEEHLHFGLADVELPGLGVKHYQDPAEMMNIDDPSRIDRVTPKGFTWEEPEKRKEDERKDQ